MIWDFITDKHKYAPNEKKNCEFTPLNRREVYLGDNIDFAYCPKKLLPQANIEHDYLKKMYGDRFCTGNHSRKLPIGDYFIAQGDKPCEFTRLDGTKAFLNRAYCTHSDKEANEIKWTKYRQVKPGLGGLWGFVKRNIWAKAVNTFEDIHDRTINEDIFRRMASVAKSHDCNIYVGGHFHPDRIVMRVVNGITIYSLPQGKSSLDF